MRSTLIKDNLARFVMDGEEFFGEVRKQLEAVAAEGVVDRTKTYVRLAFWAIADDLNVGDETRGRIALIEALKKVLLAGHNVDIIGWYPNLKARQFGGDDGKFNAEKHDKLAVALERIDMVARMNRRGRVRFYMERYEGLTGSSQHQKIAIFSRQGQRTVMVGGFNMANYYYDTVKHDGSAGEGDWHDSAVFLQGPVTDAIEAEWVRRWNRAVEMEAKIFTLNDLKNQVRARYDSNPGGSGARPRPSAST